jgi:hypothetical protein
MTAPELAADLSAASARPSRAHHLHWPIFWGFVVAALIVWGMNARLERYITPERGLGYWLGIVGASMMVLMLVYSARKRARWLRWIGRIPTWFHIHMALGVVGPLLVLFHANFRFGATNSNVALVCMLVVAGSGVIGRYVYTRLHAYLGGKEVGLDELRVIAERIRSQTTTIAFLGGVLDAIDREEQRLARPEGGRILRLLWVFTTGIRAIFARWRLHRLIDRSLALAMQQEPHNVALHADRIGSTVRDYADRRLDAGRRVAEYRVYARLFSLWHVLHIPLFFLLLIAAIAHVVAVNIY